MFESPCFRVGRVHLLSVVLSLALAAAAPAQDDIARRADGRPDLSGTYDTATLTPLVRPAKFGDNLFLTQEQAAVIEAEEQALLDRGLERSDPNREAPEKGGAAPVGFDPTQRETLGAGNVGGYNSFWIDRGSESFEIDGMQRTSIITDPANGQLPPMTAEAMKGIAESRRLRRPNDGTAWWLDVEGVGPYDDIELRPAAERCLLGFGSTQGPPMLPVLYNNHKRIVQTDDKVMILVEMIHDVRTIRLDSEHEPSSIRRWLGDSIGRWEGDTLVVHTTNFTDQPGLFRASENLEVEERFTMLDGGTMHYEFAVTDPTVWEETWKGDYIWPRTDEKIFEYACHEGNYAMGNILRGARLLEQETLAARGGDTDDD